ELVAIELPLLVGGVEELDLGHRGAPIASEGAGRERDDAVACNDRRGGDAGAARGRLFHAAARVRSDGGGGGRRARAGVRADGGGGCGGGSSLLGMVLVSGDSDGVFVGLSEVPAPGSKRASPTPPAVALMVFLALPAPPKKLAPRETLPGSR